LASYNLIKATFLEIRWTGAEQDMFGGRGLPLAIMDKKKIETGFVVGTQKLS